MVISLLMNFELVVENFQETAEDIEALEIIQFGHILGIGNV